MKLIDENATRKLDSLGRVSIPKGLRDRLKMRVGEEIYFYSLVDGGKNYICLTNDKTDKTRYTNAAIVLRELGEKIPQSLKDKILEDRE